MNLVMEAYDSTFELLGLLETYQSVIWEPRAFEAGSFSIEAILDDATRELLARENIIRITDDDAGIIEHLTLTSDESGERIKAEGRLITGFLDRRVLWGTYNLYGAPAALMYNLVSECCISPTRGTIAYRRISNMEFEGSVPSYSGASIRKQKTGGSLLEALIEIAEPNQVAFGLKFDAENLKLQFWGRYGVDRTVNQSAVDAVVYATDLDDILQSEYVYDSSKYFNTAYVGGEVNEDASLRTYETVEGSESGLNRREMFVDARDLQQKGTETLTDYEYAAVLDTRGREKLAENQLAETFEMTVRTLDPTYEYGTDFFLGDTITAQDKRLGVTVDVIVTGVQMSATSTGESMSFSFGYGQPTVYDILKRKIER